MAVPHLLYITTALLFRVVSPEVTLIADGSYWWDDFTYTSSTCYCSDDDEWANSFGGNDLGDDIQTCNECVDDRGNTTIWGFWQNLDSNFDGMGRYFSCSEYSTVDWTMRVWFCDGGSSSSNIFHVDRYSGTSAYGFNNRQIEIVSDGSGSPSLAPISFTPTTTDSCPQPTIKYYDIVDSFETREDPFSIIVQVDNSNSRRIGMNNFHIKCTQIPTPEPTNNPTIPDCSGTDACL